MHMSVWMFTFAMPPAIVLRKSSSESPLPPCSTRGVSSAARISARRTRLRFGFDLYTPCAVPIATARASTPVAFWNATASSGVVYMSDFASSPSAADPTWPISPSTVAPIAWAIFTTSAVSARFSPYGLAEASNITDVNPSFSASIVFSNVRPWS